MANSGRGASDGFRKRRLTLFMQHVERVRGNRPYVHVLDVGGTKAFWKAFEPVWRGRGIKFTIVNLDGDEFEDDVFAVRRGNATALDDYADRSFDIVHSNSVLEHVGDWQGISAMAGEVRRLAPAYFVQTPNYWFPVEPHFKLPFVHWLPEQVRAQALMLRRRRYIPEGLGLAYALSLVQGINLLSKAQVQALFPDAAMVPERVAGLTKSWIAIRDGDGDGDGAGAVGRTTMEDFERLVAARQPEMVTSRGIV